MVRQGLLVRQVKSTLSSLPPAIHHIVGVGLHLDIGDHPLQRRATAAIWVPIQMHISLGGKGGLRRRSRFDTVQCICYSYHHLMSLVLLQAMTVKIKYPIWWSIVIKSYIWVICCWSLPASPLVLLACLRQGVMGKYKGLTSFLSRILKHKHM